MHWLIPILLIFGFLIGHARHDASFVLILTIFAIIALWPLVRTLWLAKLWRVGLLFLMVGLVLSFAVAPVFAALTIALTGGAWLLADHYHYSLGRQLIIGGLAGVLPALVVEPAGLALGLWHYQAYGLYYNVPPAVALTWFCGSALIVLVLSRIVAPKFTVPTDALKTSLIILAVATGICTAFGFWLAAILGLLLLLYGFLALHYL